MKSVDTAGTQYSVGSSDINSRKEMPPPDFQTESEPGRRKKLMSSVISSTHTQKKKKITLLSADDV